MSPPQLLEPALARALALVRAGAPVLVHDADGREDETDLFVRADAATPALVRSLRRDAGGLVFVAVDHAVAEALGLPFLQDLYAHAEPAFPVLRALRAGKLPYDARSSFSLTVNHRATFTGITDADRALTLQRFGALAAQVPGLPRDQAQALFGTEFRTPGHVALCVASEPLLEARRGHTELAVALARIAGVPGALAGAEMLAMDHALPKRDAQAWAREHGTVLVEGADIVRAWASFIRQGGHGQA